METPFSPGRTLDERSKDIQSEAHLKPKPLTLNRELLTCADDDDDLYWYTIL